MKLVSFVKDAVGDAIKIVTSKVRIRGVLGASLYRNALYLMLNSGTLALTGFFFWVVAARLYPAEGVGSASAAISAMGLLALLSTLGLTYGLIRFLPSVAEKGNDMINSCFTIGGITSLALSLIFLAGLRFWSPALLPIAKHPIFFATFTIFTVVATLDSFTRQTFVAERRTGFALAQGLIFGLLRFIPLVIFVTFFQTFGIFASWGIAASVAIIVSISVFLPRIHIGYRPSPTINKRVISGIIPFSFANYAFNLLWATPTYLLPLMVLNLLGAELNAYFYIAWTLGNILFTIPTFVSVSLFAEGSHDEKNLAEDTKRSLKLTLVILVPAIIIIFLLGDKILLLFGTAYSENATRLLRILALSALPLGLNRIYFSIKRVEVKMKAVVALSTFIWIVTIGLSNFLLSRIGIMGVGVAVLASQSGVAVVIMRSLIQKCSPVKAGHM